MVGSKKYPARSMALPPVTAVAPWDSASATSSLTRSYWGSLLIGPSFTPSSVPSPTLMARACAARPSTTSS